MDAHACPQCAGPVAGDAIVGVLGVVDDWLSHPADDTTVDTVLEIARCPRCGTFLHRRRGDEPEPWVLHSSLTDSALDRPS